MSKPYKFITFGCWNDWNSTSPAVSSVLSSVSDYCKKNNDCKFMIVTGDNYYPKKIKDKQDKTNVKKYKIINVDHLKKGLNALPENIPIYLLLGNHDLDNSLTHISSNPNITLNEVSGLDKPEDCTILKEEKVIVTINNERNNNNIHLPDKLTMHFINEDSKTLFLMIDTTVYDIYNLIYLKQNKIKEKDEKKIKDAIVCYEYLDFELKDIEKILEAQKKEILKRISTIDPNNIKNIVISGHHPLAEVKVDDHNNFKKSYLFASYDLLLEIYKIFNNSVNYYYLCADYHCYQYGEIALTFNDTNSSKMIINQYIVGTGGAKLDEAIPSVDKIKIDESIIKHPLYVDTYNDLKYTIFYKINDTIKINGFLVCTSDKNDVLSFEFHIVSNKTSEPIDYQSEPIDYQIGGKNKPKTRKIHKKKGKSSKKNRNKNKTHKSNRK
jgi:hypothetical protein